MIPANTRTAVQEIFREFAFWLLEFLVVSASLLTAARLWSIRRRNRFSTNCRMARRGR